MRPASVGFHCPECVKASGQQVYRPQDLAFQPRVTIALIALNVVAYLYQQSSPTPFDEGVLFGPLVGEGEWWRLVTSAFLHGGIIHIGFNMYLLWMLGRPLEKAFGAVKYLLLYFTSMFGGAAAVTIFDWGAPTLGASGAVLGLAGAMAAVYFARGADVRQSPAFTLVLLNLALPLIIPNVSFWGHLGGVVGGGFAALVLVWLPERKQMPKELAIPVAVGLMVGFAALGVVGGEANFFQVALR